MILLQSLQNLKNNIVKIFIFILLILCVNSIKAYAYPQPNNNNNLYKEDDNFYYWVGAFYWYWDYYKRDPNETEYGGSWYKKPKTPQTLYGATLGDIYIDNAHENEADSDFGFKSYDAVWLYGNSSPPKYNNVHDRYEKPVTAYYKREKTTPSYDYITVNPQNSKNKYVDDNRITWVKTKVLTDIKVANRQSWLGRQNVVLKDFITQNSIKMVGDVGNSFERTSERGSSSSTKFSKVNYKFEGQTSSSNKEEYELYESVASIYTMQFLVDADYTIQEAANSKNGKSIGYGNDTRFKVDGSGPTWGGTGNKKNTVIIDNNGEIKDEDYGDDKVYDNLKDYKVVNGCQCIINDLRDVRTTGKDGVGVDYDNSSSISLTLTQTEKGRKSVTLYDDYNEKEKGNNKKDLTYDIDFNDENFKKDFADYEGNIDVKFKATDLLGNSTEKVVEHLEKVRPVPSNGDISVYEKMLRFDDRYFQSGGGLVRFDAINLKDLEIRIPSGNEAGANSHWIPGGLTDGGTPEAIINKIPNNDEYIKISFIN